MRRFAILLIAGLVLVGCAKSKQPPSGRWIGHFESSAVMVVAWLEISPRGDVKVSAPDILDPGEPTDEQRQAAHKRLVNDLYDSWGNVESRHYEFDGRVFRKAGGVAPQMEWNPHTNQMTLVFYFGMQRSMRIALTPVKEFTEDPWLIQ